MSPEPGPLRAYGVDLDGDGNVRHTPLDTPEQVSAFLGLPRTYTEAVLTGARHSDPAETRSARTARVVAEYWHHHAVANDWAVASHALGLVLAAFGGERDPAELGIDPATDPGAGAAVEAIRRLSEPD